MSRDSISYCIPEGEHIVAMTTMKGHLPRLFIATNKRVYEFITNGYHEDVLRPVRVLTEEEAQS